MAAAKHINAGMFKKPPDDGFHADIFRQARNPGAQAANAPDDQIYFYARLTGAVKRVNNFRINQRIAFCPDGCGLARLGKSDFLVDMGQKIGLHRNGRDRHALQSRRFGITGDKIENMRHIPRNHRISGKK